MRKEVPNILCFFRIGISLFLAFLMPDTWFDGAIFSIALISDIFDGHIYRKLQEKPSHWFNKLPISMDPIADFVFGLSGLIIGYRSGLIGLLPIILVILVNMGLVVGLQIVKDDAAWSLYDAAWSLLANISTYSWFAVMLLADFLVWHVAIKRGSWITFGITIVVFYALFFSFRDESRTIRKRG